MSGMAELIENADANPYVRWAAMGGLTALVASGQRSRDEVVSYFHGLLHKLERVPGTVWGGLTSACLDLWPGEVMEELRSAWDEGLIPPDIVNWDDVVRDHVAGLNYSMTLLKERHRPITDAVKELSKWYRFNRDVERERPKDVSSLDAMPARGLAPIRRTGPKVGRNDPCPCGSGKKYKKCCGG
jgi:hypothetical protein